ncbi:SMP-30/gluconolactonase/LRE family protein [Nocardioides acrostichi]|uniref:SMP-30/gluconolactonase/LRE family protein n=1 Tax=Nocardioides acrostichi TaxID=2784339 RepID=A0A930YCA9_9ACTN|nr:SMP-30/gluconolactonase/LRE family protein [Nocardioides acrostichi]MBF4163298.1 SMP-30/gluconolactonase/LRE family protein [Nocardioides acrostichi]
MDDAIVVAELRCAIGEGPFWDERSSRLLGVDLSAGEVWRLDPATGATDRWHLGGTVSAVLTSRGGEDELAVTRGRSVLLGCFGATDPHPWVEVASDSPVERLNDAGCDPRGRLWVGSMASDFSPDVSTLYRVGPQGAVAAHRPFQLANGLAWSPDARTLYLVDSRAHEILRFAYDPATGRCERRLSSLAVDPAWGFADGLCVAADGSLWVAMYAGWAVRQLTPEGECLAVVDLPVAKATSVCFGGPGLADLYVTTAAAGLTEEEAAAQPHAGDLFMVPGAGPGLAVSGLDPAAR